MTLGEKIKILRKKRFTQEELAERLGIHVNTLVRWERGDRVPTADKLKELADALETTSDYLLDNGDVPVSMLKVSQAEPPAEERSVVEKSRGKLLYIFKDGEKLELPDTDKGYELFKEILMRKAVMA